MSGFMLTIGSLPIATTIAASEIKDTRHVSVAWSVVVYFTPITLICFATFFWNIENTYRSTFISLEKGTDYTVKCFKETSEDSIKGFAVFTNSKHHWISIEDEVKAWVEANWERWEEEKPEWFTDALKAQVPVEFIPATGDARRRESLRRASVDAEAEGGLGGALRASIRRASIGMGEDVVRVVPINEDI